MNKLVEREAFIDSVRGKSAELKDKFLFELGFCGFLCFPGEGRDRET